MFSESAFRKALMKWYRLHRRDLPWRRTTDPYRIWISEIMLQQTRVAAVIPYYERFLERFPNVEALAEAPEADVLAAWAGLGYYSRARNVQKAARQIAALGGFPRDYGGLLALAGIGDYTAAAIASIAFHLPHAAVDGNVMRVLSRVRNDASDISSPRTRDRFQQDAGSLIDKRDPGAFNQAMMELGATICLPRQPQCLLCPVTALCQGRAQGRQDQLPVKSRKMQMVDVEKSILIIESDGKVLMWQRPDDAAKLKGFWDLPEPEQAVGVQSGRMIGEFRHSIVNHNYRISVLPGRLTGSVPNGLQWISKSELEVLPVSTRARKALTLWSVHVVHKRGDRDTRGFG